MSDLKFEEERVKELLEKLDASNLSPQEANELAELSATLLKMAQA